MTVSAAFMVPHPPLIIPEVGRGGEKQILATTNAYEKVAEEVAALKPDTIIITSPHSVMYADYFHISPGHRATGSFADFGASGVRFSEECTGILKLLQLVRIIYNIIQSRRTHYVSSLQQ